MWGSKSTRIELPPVRNRDDSSSVLSNVLKYRLRQVKVVERRVAPPAGVVGQGVVWRAEIGGGHHNWTRQTPLLVSGAPDLITRSAAQAIVEQSSTQRCRVCTIPLAVQIPIPTSPTYSTFKQFNAQITKMNTEKKRDWVKIELNWILCIPIVPEASLPP